LRKSRLSIIAEVNARRLTCAPERGRHPPYSICALVCFDHEIDASDARTGALGQRRRLGHMTIYLRGVKNPTRPRERDRPTAFPRLRKGSHVPHLEPRLRRIGRILGDPVVATALLDRLLHHAVAFQIEGSSYRLREHADLLPSMCGQSQHPTRANPSDPASPWTTAKKWRR
jgi:hypothetical protein